VANTQFGQFRGTPHDTILTNCVKKEAHHPERSNGGGLDFGVSQEKGAGQRTSLAIATIGNLDPALFIGEEDEH